jgi:hypothetical protein
MGSIIEGALCSTETAHLRFRGLRSVIVYPTEANVHEKIGKFGLSKTHQSVKAPIWPVKAGGEDDLDVLTGGR